MSSISVEVEPPYLGCALIYFIIALCLVPITGCTEHSQSDTPTLSISTKPQDPIPTLYTTEGLYTLSPTQRKEITEAAEKICPPQRDLWLILVNDNQFREGELHYDVTVYFTPDQQTSRLRKGRCFYLNNYPPVSKEWRAQLDRSNADDETTARLRGDHHYPMLLSYIQVSPPGKNFGEDQSPPTTLPFAPFAPLDGIGVFKVPKGQPARQQIADGDLTAIIDAAHSIFNGREWSRPNERVQSIEINGDFVQVLIEAHGTSPNREGTKVNIRRTDGAYKVEEVTDWKE